MPVALITYEKNWMDTCTITTNPYGNNLVMAELTDVLPEKLVSL